MKHAYLTALILIAVILIIGVGSQFSTFVSMTASPPTS